ncbi:LysR family transcriptional regulator [Chitinimonas naiadis]
MQYRLSHADLSLVLALVRGGTLARAAELLQVDVSTVFRSVRRLEQSFGTPLFEKNRSGYQASDTARLLAEQAERAEQALLAAQLSLEQDRSVVSGTVRLTCTDSVLHGLLLPALSQFMPGYPGLRLELSTSNHFANLSRHDADIALRLTNSPPEHLVGRSLGTVSYHLCAQAGAAGVTQPEQADKAWISLDETLPDHVTVLWRERHWPAVVPRYRCSTMLAAAELVEAGLGIAALPNFLLPHRPGLQALAGPLDGCSTELWLLTRPDCRALKSVSTLFDELAHHIKLA